ncbi:hypothetical protein DW973_11295 [Parabacteroides merdae]|nr:hypothetical protein DW973_11295 [Parabacteroides merdae]
MTIRCQIICVARKHLPQDGRYIRIKYRLSFPMDYMENDEEIPSRFQSDIHSLLHHQHLFAQDCLETIQEYREKIGWQIK